MLCWRRRRAPHTHAGSQGCLAGCWLAARASPRPASKQFQTWSAAALAGWPGAARQTALPSGHRGMRSLGLHCSDNATIADALPPADAAGPPIHLIKSWRHHLCSGGGGTGLVHTGLVAVDQGSDQDSHRAGCQSEAQPRPGGPAQFWVRHYSPLLPLLLNDVCFPTGKARAPGAEMSRGQTKFLFVLTRTIFNVAPSFSR